MTCWRRLHEWQVAGVWDAFHWVMLERLRQHDQIDWHRASVDLAAVAFPSRGSSTAQNPSDRGKIGCKRHVDVGGRGVPLAILASNVNEHDSVMLELLQTLLTVVVLPGRPRTWTDKFHADKSYDYAKCRASLRWCDIQARIARCGVESRDRLGRHRWQVERSMETHIALLKLACSIISARAVESYC